MADKKISALTGASTPLAGTEVLPIVQSGATVKVAVSDLTAGRAVSFAGATSTSTLWVQDTNNLQFGYNALRATINGTDAFVFTPRAGYGAEFAAEVAIAGKVQPTADNTYSCGAAARRWTEVFAASALINTSDARDKTAVRELTSAEIAASKDLAKEIGAFKFLSAVSLKGDAAREHIGMTVQRAIEIMQSHGLDASSYGFICFDKWDDQYQDIEVSEDYTDENGETQTRPVKTGERKLITSAGEKYGFRTDQLLLFIARGFEARLAVLEAK